MCNRTGSHSRQNSRTVGEPLPRSLEERLAPAELGAYAMDIGDGYLIHGTLYTRALGLSITHGCVRLGGCFRFGRLEPLLERLDAGLVAFLHLLDLLADFGELGVAGGVRVRQEDERQRECAWRQNEPVHGATLHS